MLTAIAQALGSPVVSEQLMAQSVSGVDVAVPQFVVVVAGRDAFVNRDEPLTNYGNASEVAVTRKRVTVEIDGVPSVLRSARTYFGFDLSSLCAGALVDSAVLSVRGPAGNATQGLKLETIGDPWSESTVTWDSKPSSASRISVTAGLGMYSILDIDVRDRLVDGAGRLDHAAAAVMNGFQLDGAVNAKWFSRAWPEGALRPSLTIRIGSCP
jgi:hypothetical protein